MTRGLEPFWVLFLLWTTPSADALLGILPLSLEQIADVIRIVITDFCGEVDQLFVSLFQEILHQSGPRVCEIVDACHLS